MKHIVSVSLGSSKRDHSFETEILGEKFLIERIGTDGDWDKTLALVRSLDGKVDAFGMGGIDLYLHVAGRRYTIKDAKKIIAEAKKTPMFDGGGLKNTLERLCINYVQDNGIAEIKGKKVLLVSAADRFGMAEAFDQVGAKLTMGDLIYSVGIPIPIHSLKTLQLVASIIAPFVVRMSFDSLYPTGEKQEVIIPKYSKYYYAADILAGDFLYIRRYLPEKLNGQIVITNTTTREDMLLLKERGVSKVITTTPDMGGRSFGTNVIEALVYTFVNKPVDKITPDDYYAVIKKLDMKPGVVDLRSFDA